MGSIRNAFSRLSTFCPLGDVASTASHMRVATGPGATVVVPIGVARNSRVRDRTKFDTPALVAQ